MSAGFSALCRNCKEPIELLEGIGWVEAEPGGHYDMCPDSPSGLDGKHHPDNERLHNA